MSRRLAVVLVGVGVFMIVIGLFVFNTPFSISGLAKQFALLGVAKEAPYIVPPITDEYQSDQFRFSLGMPDGFNASELESEDTKTHTILLQNAGGEGIQIMVTPFKGTAKNLTAEQIRIDIPSLKVSDEQVLEIGETNRGVAFLSNNEDFGGASREVWFYFGGNLYQISTYARFDPLLKAMFATWKFF